MEKEDKIILYEETSHSYDRPEFTDYDYAEVASYDERWSSISNALDLVRKHLIIFNQWAITQTRNWCWHYSKQHGINAMNILEDLERWKNNQINPRDFWIKWQDERMPQSRWIGTSIQQNLNTFKDKWWIGWWARCNSIQDTKHALDMWRMISTWSRDGNRPEIRKTGIYSTKKSWWIQWHLFLIGWYDDEKQIFLAPNSYWPNRWPKEWRFEIPYSEYDNLYSKNAMFDVKSIDAINTYKEATAYQREFLKAIQMGITNGDRPDKLAIRKEVAVMCYRVHEMIKIDTEAMVNKKVEEAVQKLLLLINK